MNTKLVDHVVVERVLAGTPTPCNRDERAAVIDAWTGTPAELERITGWNVNRLKRERKVA